MSYSAEDIDTLVAKIRYDLTAAQGKISELKTALASFNLPAKEAALNCPHCGPLPRGTLEEHLENVH